MPISFDLPAMAKPEDASRAAGALLAAVARGEVTLGEAAPVMTLIETFRRALGDHRAGTPRRGPGGAQAMSIRGRREPDNVDDARRAGADASCRMAIP
jgi:hypothetical protein